MLVFPKTCELASESHNDQRYNPDTRKYSSRQILNKPDAGCETFLVPSESEVSRTIRLNLVSLLSPCSLASCHSCCGPALNFSIPSVCQAAQVPDKPRADALVATSSFATSSTNLKSSAGPRANSSAEIL